MVRLSAFSLLLLTGLAAACSSTSSISGGRGGSGGDSRAATTPLDGSVLAVYLDTMGALIEGDAVQQAETFQALDQAIERAPTTTNRLRYALALATPGHPWADPAAAEQRLNALLAARDALLPEERILATIHLKEVESRRVLNAEAQRVKRDADTTLARQNEENSKRLRAASRENQRLRAELDNAQQKLEAITVIERSIREREDGSDQ
jgi:hypothetical protein